MPKRNRGKLSNRRTGSYFQHDDRQRMCQDQPSSGFRHFGRSRIQNSDRQCTSRITKKRGGNRNINGYRRTSIPASAVQNSANVAQCNRKPWHKVIAKNGTCVSKEYLIEQLKMQIDVQEFHPIAFSSENQDSVFYVDDKDIVRKLKKLKNFVILHNEQRIKFERMSAPPPETGLTPKIVQTITEVMSSKYNKVKEELDLSSFYGNPPLCELAYCPLNRPVIANAVLDIVKSHIATLQSINLSDNRIGNLSVFHSISIKAPNVKKIDLSGNLIQEIRQLEIFSGLNLEHLDLSNNPLQSKARSRSHLEAAIRKVFPGIQTLDGKPLKPVIRFGIDDTVGNVPSTKGSFFTNTGVKEAALQFLEQYLNLQDSADTKSRLLLMAAYHDNATFSMESCRLPQVAQGDIRQASQQSIPTLGHYFQDSRNALKVTDPKRRWKQLRRGKVTIATYLSEMPATHHDRTSLVLDAYDASPTLMICSLSGLFREVAPNKPVSQHAIRSFHRTFAIVPVGSGYCIINDMYFISNPTAKQIENSFASEKQLPAPQQVPVQPPVEPSPAVQEQMVATFAENSGMNVAFSHKCLVDNSWDFDCAARIFSELNRVGKIPPAAFVK